MELPVLGEEESEGREDALGEGGSEGREGSGRSKRVGRGVCVVHQGELCMGVCMGVCMVVCGGVCMGEEERVGEEGVGKVEGDEAGEVEVVGRGGWGEENSMGPNTRKQHIQISNLLIFSSSVESGSLTP